MLHRLHQGFVIFCLFIFSCSCQSNNETQFNNPPLPEQNNGFLADSQPDDLSLMDLQKDKSSRFFTLKNGLKVYIVSSPKYQKGSASMDVGAGSFSNPEDTPGLAHFLEHMLFLGTKKYPKVGEYDEFIHSHQGSMNAYTGDLHTNFYFEINNPEFEEAIDRFSQFFISPQLNPDFVAKEMNNVDSEHQKNTLQDSWRIGRIFGLMSKKSHPEQKFSVGNIQTLGHVTSEQLHDFYKNHYTADRMDLVMMSSHSLDEMENWARTKFSEVPNPRLPKIMVDSEVYDPKELPKTVYYKPKKELFELQISIPLEAKYLNNWKSKTPGLVSSLIGHEGKGSLLSYLKEQDLASGLAAGNTENDFYGDLSVNVALTQKGRKEIPKVLGAIDGYLTMLKTNPFPNEFFGDEKNMAILNLRFAAHDEGMGTASRLAVMMKKFPAPYIYQRSSLLFEIDEKNYHDLVSTLDLNRSIIMIVDPDVKTDLVETYYKAEYSFKNNYIPQFRTVTDATFHLPNKNNLVPERLPSKGVKTPQNPQDNLSLKEKLIEPDSLFSNEFSKLWGIADHQFGQPTASFKFVIKRKAPLVDEKEIAAMVLYNKVFAEMTNEWAYELTYAGVNFSVLPSPMGLEIGGRGYGEKLHLVLDDIITKINSPLKISAWRLESIKDDIRRWISNQDLDEPFRKAIGDLKNVVAETSVNYARLYDPALKKDLFANLTISDIAKVGLNLRSQGYLEGIVYGDIDLELWGSKFKEDWSHRLVLQKLKKKEAITQHGLELKGKSFTVYIPTKDNNHALIRYVSTPKRSPHSFALLSLAETYLESKFYQELRTVQLLGYVVMMRSFSTDTPETGMIYLVQSEKVLPAEIKERMVAFMNTEIEKVASLNDDEFHKIQNGLMQAKAMPDTSQDETFARFIQGIFYQQTSFRFNYEVSEALKTISKEDFINFVQKELNIAQKPVLDLIVSPLFPKIENENDTFHIKNAMKALNLYGN